DVLLALMVGNIRHWKGQDIVLSAVARLAPAVRGQVHVAFAGAASPADASYVASLEATVREAGIGAQISFLGARTDVPDLMNAADVVIHASRVPEPFGIVVVEGLALGKPVLATHFGGPLEVLTPESGRLYDPDRPAELAALLMTLLGDPALRRRLASGAKERAAHFDATETTRAIEALYGELLAAPPATLRLAHRVPGRAGRRRTTERVSAGSS
ncbi:MAG TPA: glycosyltransferase, partial [Gemmatimonadaceae bacterium]|nr:glycosyltransferase [Gemmatimonadaceae bacterium]